MMPEVSTALPGTDSAAADTAAVAPAADPPSPYSTRPNAAAPNAAAPVEATAIAEATVAVAANPAGGPGSHIFLLPPGTMNLNSQMNLSAGTNMSVPSGWTAAQEGLEQLDSCTSALLRAGVVPAEANSMVRSARHARPRSDKLLCLLGLSGCKSTWLRLCDHACQSVP